MTTLKTRLSEAQEIAKHLAERFLFDKVVDTIVCLEGTQVIGAYLAEELTRAGVLSTNAHKTIYVITQSTTAIARWYSGEYFTYGPWEKCGDPYSSCNYGTEP